MQWCVEYFTILGVPDGYGVRYPDEIKEPIERVAIQEKVKYLS